MKQSFYKGAQGNLSLHVITVALATLASGSKKLLEESLPIGTEVTGVRIIHENLGASTAVQVDLVDKEDNAKSVLASKTTTSAGVAFTPIKPVYIGDEGESDLVLTNSGANSASGEVTIQLEYRFKGY